MMMMMIMRMTHWNGAKAATISWISVKQSWNFIRHVFIILQDWAVTPTFSDATVSLWFSQPISKKIQELRFKILGKPQHLAGFWLCVGSELYSLSIICIALYFIQSFPQSFPLTNSYFLNVIDSLDCIKICTSDISALYFGLPLWETQRTSWNILEWCCLSSTLIWELELLLWWSSVSTIWPCIASWSSLSLRVELEPSNLCYSLTGVEER